MTYIQSKQNPRYKRWKKLQTKKGREKEQLFLVEGEHLVQEALLARWPIRELIVSSEYEPPKWLTEEREGDLPRFVLPPSLFAHLSETKTPQGIAAVVAKQSFSSFAEVVQNRGLVLLVDGIQDPGNIGTLIRTAEAAGVEAFVLGKGSADPYAGKALRATQGSLFHLPLYALEMAKAISVLREQGWIVIGSALKEAVDYRNVEVDAQDRLALLVGNEGQGVAEQYLQQTDMNIKLPIWGKAESLNVAVATGIMLYSLQASRKSPVS